MTPASTAAVKRITRRRLVQAGAAGAATVWLGRFEHIEGIARAAVGSHPELSRATYAGLSSATFGVAGGTSLELVSVGDLPVAESVPGLQGRDDAFLVRFRGAGATPLTQGTHTMSHPQLGRFDLFIAPVDQAGDEQDYEAVVDRTVRIPGLDEDGGPEPVKPPRDRREATGSGAAGRSGTAAKKTVKLLKVSLRRGASARRLLARVTLGGQADVASVHALLVRNGRVFARASSAGRRADHRLSFRVHKPVRYQRYRLMLTIIDRDGHVTRLSRVLRLPKAR
jgi:hypothetical protein